MFVALARPERIRWSKGLQKARLTSLRVNYLFRALFVPYWVEFDNKIRWRGLRKGHCVRFVWRDDRWANNAKSLIVVRVLKSWQGARLQECRFHAATAKNVSVCVDERYSKPNTSEWKILPYLLRYFSFPFFLFQYVRSHSFQIEIVILVILMFVCPFFQTIIEYFLYFSPVLFCRQFNFRSDNRREVKKPYNLEFPFFSIFLAVKQPYFVDFPVRKASKEIILCGIFLNKNK